MVIAICKDSDPTKTLLCSKSLIFHLYDPALKIVALFSHPGFAAGFEKFKAYDSHPLLI